DDDDEPEPESEPEPDPEGVSDDGLSGSADGATRTEPKPTTDPHRELTRPIESDELIVYAPEALKQFALTLRRNTKQHLDDMQWNAERLQAKAGLFTQATQFEELVNTMKSTYTNNHIQLSEGFVKMCDKIDFIVREYDNAESGSEDAARMLADGIGEALGHFANQDAIPPT
ncbi:MAG: hypothetical protein AAFP84_07695, partial [Actinomycetota bacterium]